MQKEWIVIRGIGSLSGLGCTTEEVQQTYTSGASCFSTFSGSGQPVAVSPLSASSELLLQNLLQEKPKYATLDRSVLMAIAAARQAVQQAGWETQSYPIGINLGSSRGATELFEKYHTEFLAHPHQKLPAQTSPSTTLGNLASWVAQDLTAQGPLISHSATCSTALQAIANGVAWLKAGMAKRFLVGGTEAPLTPFTIAQMRAIGIYSPFGAQDRPCRPLEGGQANTFVLGEGAAVLALERMTEAEISLLPTHRQILVVAGIGMGLEQAPSKTGVTPGGLHFQTALREALAQAELLPAEIDALILHAPGTKAGDAAEVAALKAVFSKDVPFLFSNKLIIGHTLGASGVLSATLGEHLLKKCQTSNKLQVEPSALVQKEISSVLINAAGFGGNATSILIKRLQKSI